MVWLRANSALWIGLRLGWLTARQWGEGRISLRFSGVTSEDHLHLLPPSHLPFPRVALSLFLTALAFENQPSFSSIPLWMRFCRLTRPGLPTLSRISQVKTCTFIFNATDGWTGGSSRALFLHRAKVVCVLEMSLRAVAWTGRLCSWRGALCGDLLLGTLNRQLPLLLSDGTCFRNVPSAKGR